MLCTYLNDFGLLKHQHNRHHRSKSVRWHSLRQADAMMACPCTPDLFAQVQCPSVWERAAIWRFPKMEVRPNHTKLGQFSIETHGFGIPHFQNPPSVTASALEYSIALGNSQFCAAEQNRSSRGVVRGTCLLNKKMV